MVRKLIKCAYCGDSFVRQRKTARFCTDKCRVYFNRNKGQKKEESHPKSESIVNKIKKVYSAICEHGALKGYCEKGCKPDFDSKKHIR